ncbi:MAG: hypothetical protein JNJ54_36945 [Myxococcaceae bacterium]|nr:hypothetical protein [Myxococcaceae bacterium]
MSHWAPVSLHALTVTPQQALAFGVELSKLVEATGFQLRTADPRRYLISADGSLHVVDQLGRDLSAETLSWFSPEYVRGLETSATSDVFLVGLAVIGALTHRSPYLRESPLDTLRAAMEGQWAQPLRAMRPDVVGPMVEVLVRAVLPKPEQRTPSLAALRQALGPLASPLGTEHDWRSLVAQCFSTRAPLEAAPDELASDQARLVAADQLEEEGRHDEAQWVRLECHVRSAEGSALEPLRETLAPLSDALGPARVAPLARGPIERCPLVCGGACPGTWERLLLTTDPAVRRCGTCGADVLFELTVAAAWQRVLDGRTVVVDVAAPRTFGDLTPADMDQIT